MAGFTQSEIDALVSCPKGVSDPPKRTMRLDGSHWRNDAGLLATDGTVGEFGVFMRRSEDFPENFSVGLKYRPGDGRDTITLIRCNGRHSPLNAPGPALHTTFHVHRASEAALEEGRRAESDASATQQYASYEEAVQYFVDAINLNGEDRAKHFPNQTQGVLSF